MSNSPRDTNASDSSAYENPDEPTLAAEILCSLGSLSGEHTVKLSQMTSDGDPIPAAPHITVWSDEPNPPNNDKPLAVGVTTLITDTKGNEYPPYMVTTTVPHKQWFDYSSATPPKASKQLTTINGFGSAGSIPSRPRSLLSSKQPINSQTRLEPSDRSVRPITYQIPNQRKDLMTGGDK